MTIAERKRAVQEKKSAWYGFFPRTFQKEFVNRIGKRSTGYDFINEFELNGYKIQWNDCNDCYFIWHNGHSIYMSYQNSADYAEMCLLRPIMVDLCEEAANEFLNREVEEVERQEALAEMMFQGEE